MSLGAALDAVLAASLLWIAYACLSSRNLFRAVVLFVAFGLLLALAWARQRAPDVALAEAAIGAGLTGALLLDAVGRLQPAAFRRRRAGAAVLGVAAIGAAALAFGLGRVIAELPAGPADLAGQVAGRLDESGVTHPVTAVLLNFRSHDTLLEVAVLLLAALGARALPPEPPPPLEHAAGDRVLHRLSRLLLPLAVLLAAHLLLVGASRPGGAFQAAAVLAGAAVLLRLTHDLPPRSVPGRGWEAAALAAGLGLFLAVAVGTALFGGHFLGYPPALAGGLIVLVEAALTLSIAFALWTLYP